MTTTEDRPADTELDLLVRNLGEAATIANVDLDRIAAPARPSWVAAKRDAEEKIVGLRKTYSEKLSQNLLGLLLDGAADKQAAFVKAAETDAPAVAFPVNARAVYAPLVDAVEEALGQERIFNVNPFVRLKNALYGILEKFEELPVPELKFVGDIALPTRADVEDLVSATIRASGLGDELLLAAVKRSVFEQAEKIRYAETATPVIVTGALNGERPALMRLFKQKAVNVNLKKDVDGETVQKAFAALKNKIKQPTKP